MKNQRVEQGEKVKGEVEETRYVTAKGGRWRSMADFTCPVCKRSNIAGVEGGEYWTMIKPCDHYIEHKFYTSKRCCATRIMNNILNNPFI